MSIEPSSFVTVRDLSADGLFHKLRFGLRGGFSTCILDVRLRQGFTPLARSISDAVAIVADDDPVLVPDVDRDQPILVCAPTEYIDVAWDLALGLIDLGYRHVWRLEVGIETMTHSTAHMSDLQIESRQRIAQWTPLGTRSRD